MKLSRYLIYAALGMQAANCSLVQAQPGVGQANAPVAVPSAAGTAKATVKPVPLATTKRVSDWFGKYDQIRRKAQMTPAEKSSAHKLLAAALSNKNNEKTAAKNMLSSMSARYQKAVSSLNSLPEVPETRNLQQGYLNYFRTGNSFFQQYLKTLSSNVSPASTVGSIQGLDSARKQMRFLDISNKLLDKKLRKQYNVAAFQS